MTTRPTGSFTKDPRLDRAISWGLTTFALVALAVCAYFFRDLTGTVKDLGLAVSGLKTEVAVMRADRKAIDELKSEQRSIRARIRTLEQAR